METGVVSLPFWGLNGRASTCSGTFQDTWFANVASYFLLLFVCTFRLQLTEGRPATFRWPSSWPNLKTYLPPPKYAALSSRGGNGKMASMSRLNFIEPVSQPPNGPQMEDRFTHSAPFTFSNSGDRQSLASKRCKQADSPLWLKRYGSSSFPRGGASWCLRGNQKQTSKWCPKQGTCF